MEKPIITKEHGSWAILFVPVIMGISAAQNFDHSIWILAISIFFLFMSYAPAEILLLNKLKKRNFSNKDKNAKSWLIIYFSIAVILGLFAVIFFNKYLLLFFGAVASIFFLLSQIFSFKFKKNVWSDLIAMFGLTLSAPAMIYFLDGKLNQTSLLVWFFNLIFFASSAIYVHFKIKIASVKNTEKSFSEISLGKLNLIFHVFAISLLIFFAVKFPSKIFLSIAFLPMFVHALLGTFKLSGKTNFKKLGFTLLGYSIIFAMVISIFVR